MWGSAVKHGMVARHDNIAPCPASSHLSPPVARLPQRRSEAHATCCCLVWVVSLGFHALLGARLPLHKAELAPQVCARGMSGISSPGPLSMVARNVKGVLQWNVSRYAAGKGDTVGSRGVSEVIPQEVTSSTR